MVCKFQALKYLINYINVGALTTGRMIPSEITSPPIDRPSDNYKVIKTQISYLAHRKSFYDNLRQVH